MVIFLPDSRELSDEVLAVLRLRALRAYEMGVSEKDTAEVLGVTRETVSRWWAAYETGRLEGLPQK